MFVKSAVPYSRLPSSKGQALPVGMFFLFVSMALMYFMFNSGQAVGEKVRVTNAADLAAYSVGVQEARALNYDAYTNRAIVANEIAIAQMLSLQSWVHYFNSAVDNSPAIAGYVARYFSIPSGGTLKAYEYAGLLGGTDYLDAYTGGQSLDYMVQAVDYASIGIVTAHDAAVLALSASQKLVHASMLLGAYQTVLANDVVKAMDNKMTAVVVPLPGSYEFDSFTKSYDKDGSGGDQRGRLADVITRSRDKFTENRSWTLNGATLPLLQKNVALKKRGGTELVNYDQWKAMDTAEGHAQTFGCGKWGLSWCEDIKQPLAWGGARAVSESSGSSGGFKFSFGKAGGCFGGGSNQAGYLGGAYAENAEAARCADREMVTVTDDGAMFHGLPSSRDLANLNGPGTTGITVMVAKSGGDVRTTSGSSATKPSGQFDLFGAAPPGGRMASLSRALVYFDRPVDRADGRVENPSLYNPYWNVRLVAPTATDRAFAAALQGGKELPP